MYRDRLSDTDVFITLISALAFLAFAEIAVLRVLS